jgi:hypothetical protein
VALDIRLHPSALYTLFEINLSTPLFASGHLSHVVPASHYKLRMISFYIIIDLFGDIIKKEREREAQKKGTRGNMGGE